LIEKIIPAGLKRDILRPAGEGVFFGNCPGGLCFVYNLPLLCADFGCFSLRGMKAAEKAHRTKLGMTDTAVPDSML
jgi:hypothetical protein